MVDEISDVASHKRLAILCKYLLIAPDTSVKTAILNDVEMADGANTITKKIVNQIKTVAYT